MKDTPCSRKQDNVNHSLQSTQDSVAQRMDFGQAGHHLAKICHCGVMRWSVRHTPRATNAVACMKMSVVKGIMFF